MTVAVDMGRHPRAGLVGIGWDFQEADDGVVGIGWDFQEAG
jgi:hypothetical protein